MKALLGRWTLLFGLLWTTLGARAGTITVFGATSLTDALTEIGQDYERETGEKVVFNFAASSILARQIQDGAPADVFFSADEAKMDGLARQGLIATNTRVRRLSNTLVVVVPLDAKAAALTAADLAKPEIQRVALADPKAVPAGIYAKAWLTRLGLWAAVEPKVIPALNVRAALAMVESGNVEAGIVFKTDAAISRKVKVACAAPTDETPEISYPMAIVQETKQTELARKFLDFLNSEAAGREFEKFGFVVLRPRL